MPRRFPPPPRARGGPRNPPCDFFHILVADQKVVYLRELLSEVRIEYERTNHPNQRC